MAPGYVEAYKLGDTTAYISNSQEHPIYEIVLEEKEKRDGGFKRTLIGKFIPNMGEARGMLEGFMHAEIQAGLRNLPLDTSKSGWSEIYCYIPRRRPFAQDVDEALGSFDKVRALYGLKEGEVMPGCSTAA